jgi:hypothetical protein
MSHAGSEQDAIQGAFGRLQRARSWLSHYCDWPVFGRGGGGRQAALATGRTPLAFARPAHGGLVRADEVIE